MPKAFVNGIHMHYQCMGQGPDVVLIHGITATMAMWHLKIVPGLTKDYRVITYDLRGHGYSDIPPTGYTSADMASDLYALLDYLQIERAYLVGHSFGGAIALHLAALYPERIGGAAIADAGIPALLHLRTLHDWPGWTLWKNQLEALGAQLDEHSTPEDIDPERIIRKSFQIPLQFGLRKGQERKTKRMERLLDETSVIKEFRQVAGLTEEKLAQIRRPVLAIYGANSIYRKIGLHLQDLLPNCKALALAGTGHFYLVRDPDMLLKPLRQFLRNPSKALTGLQDGAMDEGTAFREGGVVA